MSSGKARTRPFRFKTAASLASVTAGLLLASLAAVQAPATAGAPVHQLRIYVIFEGNRAAFHERFRDHATRLMCKHGFEIVAMWEAKSPERTEFVYVLAWPDLATMDERWAGFMADGEWSDIKARTAAQHGPLVGRIESRVLRLTDYSRPLGS